MIEKRRTAGGKLYTCKESVKNVKSDNAKIYIKETKEKANDVIIKLAEKNR